MHNNNTRVDRNECIIDSVQFYLCSIDNRRPNCSGYVAYDHME